jgi:hypothetical protein
MRILILPLLFFSIFLGAQDAQSPAIFLSTDYGETWVPFDQGMPEMAFVSDVVNHHGTLYASTDGHGVYALPPAQQEWIPVNEGFVGRVDVNALASRGDLLVAGTYRSGIYLSRNGGKRWQRPVFNVKGFSITTLFMSRNSNTIYAGTDRGLYASEDNGNTWQVRSSGPQINDLFEFGDQLFAARTDGLVVSRDRGATWESLYDEFTVREVDYLCPYLYARVGRGIGWIRKIDGSNTWENPLVRLPLPPAGPLMSARWTGLKLEGPEGIAFRKVFSTSIGWLAAGSPGC